MLVEIVVQCVQLSISHSLRLNSFHPVRDPFMEGPALLVIANLNNPGQMRILSCIVPSKCNWINSNFPVIVTVTVIAIWVKDEGVVVREACKGLFDNVGCKRLQGRAPASSEGRSAIATVPRRVL